MLIAPTSICRGICEIGRRSGRSREGGADWLHIDVMDGHFVPNLTVGPLIVEGLKPHTRLPLDCHRRSRAPRTGAEGFAHAGASTITVHAEASVRDGLLGQIRSLGCKAGVSINPATPVSAIERSLDG